MGRKRKGIPIHGWLIIDKPLEMSSNNVVGKVRYLTQAQKVGHGGTLDPLASGVLPIALGEATKTVSYVMDGTKTYRFEVTWGESRNTDDAEGEVVATSDNRPSEAEIQAVLDNFVGEIEQTPPIYSAIKIDGKRAYKLAREDEEVEMPSRIVRIDRLILEEIVDANRARFLVTCGKGTYVRALARDLGEKLGCLGYVSLLRRTKVAKFDESSAISLDKLEALMHSDALFEALLPVETVLDDIPALALTAQETQRIRHGNTLSVLSVANRLPLKQMSQGDAIRVMDGDKMVALAKIEAGQVRPVRVLNL